MDITIAIALVAGGLLLLVAGGEAMLRGAVGLATLLRLTPAVIGLTVVAAGTSVPELAVSIIAAFRDSADIAVGNVVGSNIFNIAAILGLSGILAPLKITGNTIKLEYPVLVLVTLMLLAVADDGTISRLDAVLFIAVYIGFTAYLLSLVRQQLSANEKKDFRTEVEQLTPATTDQPSMLMCLTLVFGGAALLGGGAHLTVTGAVQLAELWGLSERVIGLTIVAAGTGLPEVVTSMVSTYRGRDDVAIANVIGSNMFNILGILAFGAIVSPLPVAPAIIASDAWWMMGITLLLFPLMFTGMRINRWEACVLLSVYTFYLAWLLARPE